MCVESIEETSKIAPKLSASEGVESLLQRIELLEFEREQLILRNQQLEELAVRLHIPLFELERPLLKPNHRG